METNLIGRRGEIEVSRNVPSKHWWSFSSVRWERVEVEIVGANSRNGDLLVKLPNGQLTWVQAFGVRVVG